LEHAAGRNLVVTRGTAANLIRGQLGKLMRRQDHAAYARYFAPVKTGGPGGFVDSPRPFVLRVRNLEGVNLRKGDRFVAGLNLFEVTAFPLFRELLERALCVTFGSQPEADWSELVTIPLSAPLREVERLRVEFLTPTELKGAPRPEFGPLFERIRDRISLLGALYGGGPLQIEFREMGERARSIRMTRCDLEHHTASRRSRGTAHPLDGFTGVAEYEGDLTEFVPYLEAARWTGVGRQTVWGKGEIRCETF
jgi:hypothetical protein